MKAAVVYESMYGNTHSVAEAIAEGLGLATTDVVSPKDAEKTDLTGPDLLVVGGPTHAHGMTRSQTRQAAVEDARSEEKELTLDPSAEGPGMRDPESFLVSRDSVLLPGELARARKWGQMLASTLRDEQLPG